jgi:type II secretory pathway pseudopilin PulG
MLRLPRLKGLEAMPIRLMAGLVLIAVVVSVSFYELNTFLQFQKEKQFKEELVNIRQAMRTLQSMGDKGSFTSIEITVPGGYTVFLNNKTNQVVGTLGRSDSFVVNLTGTLTGLEFPGGCNSTGCLLEPADYEMRLVYGGLGEPKNYSITFK